MEEVLNKLEKQIETLEDAFLICRFYPGLTEIIGQEQIQRDIEYIKGQRDSLIEYLKIKPIRKFKYLR